MSRSRPITFLAGAAVIALVASALAACGGSSGSAATAATSKHPSSSSATVHVANSNLGSILVDSQGRTLYLFKADSATRSACSGACATAWPPLLAKGAPTAGSGLAAAKLGTVKRPGGGKQVTYNGHPLYLYAGDTKAGDDAGQGVTAFGAPWYVLSSAGNQITRRPSSSSSGGTSGGTGTSIY